MGNKKRSAALLPTEAQLRRAKLARDFLDQEEEYRELQKAIEAERERRANDPVENFIVFGFLFFAVLFWLIATYNTR